MNEKILAVMHLPPPLHGTTLMNTYIAKSQKLQEMFDLRILPIQFARDVSESGRFSVRKLIVSVRLLLSLLKELIFFRPTLVYMTPGIAGWAFYRDLFLTSVIKLFPVKVVFHLHGKGIRDACESSIRYLCYKLFFARTEVIILSEKMLWDIKDVFKKKPYVLPNALPKCVEPNFIAGEVEQKMVRLLYLSNLTRSKGLLDLLDALEILRAEELMGFVVEIVGQPNDVSEVELNQQIKARKLESYVVYIGTQYGEEKEKRYQEADLFVLPTRDDVFPLVILEAMQYGLPVIASDLAAISDMVEHGGTGYLIQPGNVYDLSEKMRNLIRSPVRRKQMGVSGRERFLSQFTVDRFEECLADIFRRICGSSHSVCAQGSGVGSALGKFGK